MGLLFQALAGGLASGANAAAGIMVNNELENARSLREQNLMRMKQQYSDQSEIAKEARVNAYNDTGIDPDTRVNGELATRAAVKAQPAINAEGKRIQAEVAARQAAANAPDVPEPSPEDVDYSRSATPEETKAAKDAAGPTADEAKKIGLIGELSSGREAMMQSKMEMQQAINQAKYDALKEMSDDKSKSAELRGEMRGQMEIIKKQMDVDSRRYAVDNKGGGKDSTHADNIAADVEEMRADKILQSVKGEEALLTLAQKTSRDRHLGRAAELRGEPPADPHERQIHNGWNDPGTFGTPNGLMGDSQAAAPPPVPKSQYNFDSLPKGSQPVVGKFTKDGRPVFKAPNGQLIAPKLQ